MKIDYHPRERPRRQRFQQRDRAHRQTVSDFNTVLEADRAYMDSVLKELQKILADLNIEWEPPNRTPAPGAGGQVGG